VLDLAAGGGRHTRFLLERGFLVSAVDRDTAAVATLDEPRLTVIAIDLEDGAPWRLGGGYDGIVVTNYLHRPLFPALEKSLAEDGVLLYETFAQGNERFGHPRNPAFLLRPGELLGAFPTLTVIAFEQGYLAAPRPAVVQRIAAIRGAQARIP
jgi:SAM-dependent methyltransferase